MKPYILGSRDTAFVVGVSHCAQLDAKLPFIAFAPTSMIVPELEMTGKTKFVNEEEEVERSLEAFMKHGTVIFFDNPAVAEGALSMISSMFDVAASTSWIDREQFTGRII